MAVTADFTPSHGRVRLTLTGLPGTGTVTIHRLSMRPHASGSAAIPYEEADVRGWSAKAWTGTEATAFDYEYDPSDGNRFWYTTYRVTTSAGDDWSTTVTPVQDDWWIKSVQNPSRNLRANGPTSADIGKLPAAASVHLTVSDLSPVKRVARVGRFDIVGSQYPVMVTDVHTAAEYSITVLADTKSIATRLEDLACGGDVLFVQAPARLDAPGPLWAVAGDWSLERPSSVHAETLATIPLTRCAPPSPDVIASAWTYSTTRGAYGSYAALMNAWSTYQTFVEGPAPGEVAA